MLNADSVVKINVLQRKMRFLITEGAFVEELSGEQC